MRVAVRAWTPCALLFAFAASSASHGATTCAPEFASKVLDHWVGWDPDPAGTNPDNILGNNTAYYSTGKGGGITVAFSKAFSTTGDANPDLCISEYGNADCYYVCLKPDDTFTKNALLAAGLYPDPPESGVYEVAFPCGSGNVDIDHVVPGYAAGKLLFTYVLLADDGSSGNGAELQSVEAKAICSTVPDAGDCFSSFATQVDSYTVGSGASSGETNPNDALGSNGATWFNTGKGGKIELSFGQPFSTSGDSQADLCVDEAGGSNYADCYYICVTPANDFTKNALIAAGIAPSNGFYEVGFACGDKNLDLDGVLHGFGEGVLSFATLMLVDDGDQANGAEIAAVEAKFICPGATPECEPRFASEVLAFKVGSNPNSGGPNPNDALGNTTAYFSLGNGGSIELGYGDPLSTSGDNQPDLCVTEKADNDCYYVALKPADDFTKNALIAAGLSQSPPGFYKLGKFCGNEDIDIDDDVDGHAFGELMFSSVVITDDNNGSDGAELQALEAKFVCPGMDPAKLGDFVFEDVDGDGIQDGNEGGVPGVSVTLFDSNGQQVGAALTTGTDGRYEFCVPAGTYTVCFGLPSGFLFSPADVNGNGADASDSDADPVSGCSPQITLGPGDVDHTIDAGLIPNQVAKLGDRVWEDLNADGRQAAGEPGVSGVKVTLLDATGAPAGQETTTNLDGEYLFCVTPGSYSVRFELPAGFEFTGQNSGNDDALDSDANPTTGITQTVTLGSGQENLTVDAGLVAIAKLGNFVFEDHNGDGLQGANEPGVADVSVILLDQNGNPTGQQTATLGDGTYSFCVDPGTYQVRFVAPAGTTITLPNTGDDNLDSDADPQSGLTSLVTLQSGETNLSIDCGIVAQATLGDLVFIDADRDGLQDQNELGVAGVKVCLIDFNTQLTLAETTTDKDGKYLFLVAPGCYQVRFKVSNPIFAYTLQKIGGNDEADSDANSAGLTQKVVVQSGDAITSVDAGVIINNCAGSAFLSQPLPACGLPIDPILTVTKPYIGAKWTFTVQTPGLAPNSLVYLLASPGAPQNIQLPVSPCLLYVNPQALIILELAYTDNNGEYVRVFQIPPIAELIGLELTVQARLCDPTHPGPIPGFPDFFSNGFHVRLGCP